MVGVLCEVAAASSQNTPTFPIGVAELVKSFDRRRDSPKVLTTSATAQAHAALFGRTKHRFAQLTLKRFGPFADFGVPSLDTVGDHGLGGAADQPATRRQ